MDSCDTDSFDVTAISAYWKYEIFNVLAVIIAGMNIFKRTVCYKKKGTRFDWKHSTCPQS